MAKFNKILLTGINGQVGHALYPKLQAIGEVFALDRSQLDLSNADAIRNAVQHIKPDLIINPAAYTAVDKAEAEPELAHAINGVAPGILAEEAAKLGALLVHYSTDYVFDGSKTSAYVESDETNPVNVYGASKLAGEQAVTAVGGPHLIFRTSWVYGAYGKNFMRTILRLASEKKALRIVSDQHGAPTSSDSIADATIAALEAWNGSGGVYHLVNSGETSWHGFSQEIIRLYQQIQEARNLPRLKLTVENVDQINTVDYPTPARRPLNSRLATEKLERLISRQLPSWNVALADVINTIS